MSLISKQSRGFTLVEMLVTLSIVTIIMTVIITSQSKYVDGAALRNLADELGLTISQAQAYGIAVREFTPGSAEFSYSYGITASLLASGSSQAYLFFADRNANGVYDGTWACLTGGTSECREKKDFTRGNYIFEICALRTAGTDQCSNIGRVDITFLRPETAARLTFYNTGGNLYVPPNLKGARITLKSLGGGTRSVIVYQSGQISVQ